MRKRVVSVIGGHKCTDEVEQIAQELGKKLAIHKAIAALDGVGDKVAERLIVSGIESIEQLAASTIEQLTAIEGIGEKKAHKVIESARKAMGKQSEFSKDPAVQQEVS